MRLLLLLLMLLPNALIAQQAATLVADRVTLNDQDQLIASGNVEVLYLDTRLTASQITYDQPSDTLTINGPIVIRAADGTVLTADQAELDPRLENGILLGARLVLDQQVQLAANQIDRRDGRYSQLYRTAATSCQICGTRPPLWEIRAERVVHDEDAQQLYFDSATFRIRGVPVLWLPRMRLPDPNLDRASGFLIPEQRNTNQLGTGIKIPYFVTLGDHQDITVTPYLAAETRTLELIYRRAFANGDLRAEGAISEDSLEPENRSYIFAQGNFKLPNEYQLRFDIEAVSDPAYLLDYGYSDKDRLDSAIGLLRVTDNTLFDTSFTYYQTLRDDESNASLPPIVADLRYETRLAADFGGTLTLGTSIDTAYRYSDVNGDAGRDVTRAGIDGTWRNNWIVGNGFVGGAETGLRMDIYGIRDDTDFAEGDLRVVPSAELTLRWPLMMQSAAGTAHLLEPVVAIGWADAFGGTPPNEDSARSELDQANLFDLSRFAGEDSVETGSQAALGATWTSLRSGGGSSTLAFGRVIRDTDQIDFTKSSGLDGTQSDWLLAGQIAAPGGFVFEARSLFDDDVGLNRADSRIVWQNDTIALSAAYIWQSKDAEEDRPDTISEWTVDGAFDFSDAWTVNFDARYDVAADRPISGGLGLVWRNECVTIDVSASRRYTSSTTVDPTTTYGLSASVNGFSAGRPSGPAAGCRN